MGDLIFLIIIICVVNWIKKQSGASKKTGARRQTIGNYRPAQPARPTGGRASRQGAQLSLEDMMAQARSSISAAMDRAAKPEKPAAPAKKKTPVSGSLDYDSHEGLGTAGEGQGLRELVSHADDHVVKPFTETSHIHTESTIMGEEACTPDKKPHQEAQRQPAGDMPDIRKAIIWSEIIGKPKALRR